LPFFVLGAPVVARALDVDKYGWFIAFIGLALFINSWDWYTELRSRPFKKVMFLTPREERLLGGEIEDVYLKMTNMIKENQCSRVGVSIGGNYPEYPLWVFLDAPRDDLEIEWIISENDPSGDYRKLNFEPCALICQFCPKEWDTFRDLPLIYEESGYRLYLE
jgi:hypothetical protein